MNRESFINDILPLQQKVFRFALSFTHDRQEADDITQETYEKLWARRDELDRYSNLEGMIMRSVRNLCLDKIKLRRIHTERLADYKSEQDVQEAANERFDTRQTVQMAIKRLPERQQTIIHLRDIEGYEMDKVAEIMEIREDAARVLLSRARKQLKTELTNIMNYGVQ
ncbi:MAG: RNA polymerase sigma factor [Tidjanibacter sp.]|nr:RNA polymerase sigma factor [Tidjanibacter sp.]